MISANAAKIPPNAWPLTTAVTYSEGNRPEIPKIPPPKIAAATENGHEMIFKFNFPIAWFDFTYYS